MRHLSPQKNYLKSISVLLPILLMHTKFPVYVIVLDVANIGEHSMVSQFFQYSLRLNATSYTEILETVVPPLIDTLYAMDGRMIFKGTLHLLTKGRRSKIGWMTFCTNITKETIGQTSIALFNVGFY